MDQCCGMDGMHSHLDFQFKVANSDMVAAG
jgi:hypothetical protein